MKKLSLIKTLVLIAMIILANVSFTSCNKDAVHFTNYELISYTVNNVEYDINWTEWNTNEEQWRFYIRDDMKLTEWKFRCKEDCLNFIKTLSEMDIVDGTTITYEEYKDIFKVTFENIPYKWSATAAFTYDKNVFKYISDLCDED